MEININPDDRYSRFIIGLGLFLNIFALEPTVPVIVLLLFLGAAFWISAWTGNSLVYGLLKINTGGAVKKKENQANKR